MAAVDAGFAAGSLAGAGLDAGAARVGARVLLTGAGLVEGFAAGAAGLAGAGFAGTLAADTGVRAGVDFVTAGDLAAGVVVEAGFLAEIGVRAVVLVFGAGLGVVGDFLAGVALVLETAAAATAVAAAAAATVPAAAAVWAAMGVSLSGAACRDATGSAGGASYCCISLVTGTQISCACDSGIPMSMSVMRSERCSGTMSGAGPVGEGRGDAV